MLPHRGTILILCSAQVLYMTILFFTFFLTCLTVSFPRNSNSPNSYPVTHLPLIMSDVSMKQLMGQALKNVREENNSSSASITRLFFCGAFGDTTADSICSSLNQIKQQTEQHTASEQVTKITGGAMIVSNSAVVGFLECPSSVVATILSEIKSRNLLLNARILSTSEDCPCR